MQLITKKSQAELKRSKLDEIIKRMYGDIIEGKIRDERFAKMSANYEKG